MDLKLKLGGSVTRIDGIAKVTGAARYASDEPLSNPAHGFFITSAIARGRILGFDLQQARAVPGVIDILTHESFSGPLEPAIGPDGHPTTTIMESDQIWHDGQIIGIVIAESYEAARDAAYRSRVKYAPEKPSATFDSPGVVTEPHKPERGTDPKKGDAAKAFETSAVKFEAHYETPTQHHNPIELFTTTCSWNDGRLMIYEPSQFMWGTKASAAKRLKVDPENVRAVCRYIGGAFGSKGPNPRTFWVAKAAQKIGRPLKIVPTRDQAFTINTYRAETRHHIKLGATAEGELTAFSHEGWEVSSRPSPYNVAGVESTSRMYACPHIHTAVNVVHADRNTPGYMRAPPETPYMFALESAMDELAERLNLDPIELRRRNDTPTDPVEGRPFSSRSLMKCFDQAGERFGWSKRHAMPAQTQEGDWQIGYGCATACYPSNVAPAACRVAITADGKAEVAIAGHEIGTGAYTTVAIVAAHCLGIDLKAITVHMGDSDLPPLMIAGGSNNAASASLVVERACRQIREKLTLAAVNDHDSAFYQKKAQNIELANGKLTAAGRDEPLQKAVARLGERVEVYAEHVPEGLPPSSVSDMTKGKPAMLSGASRKDVTAYAFGAHFVEVRVHAQTREVRVARVVSAFSAGTIVNSLTAYSQFMGGVIWGLSSALLEETEIDRATARYVNHNLADYLIAVNADVPDVEVIIVPEDDTQVNDLGIKGIGEIGIVGMNAAVANAVYNATGRRIRELPIRADKLL